MARWLGGVALGVGLMAYAFGTQDAWQRAQRARSGLDFASYYYAVQVAAEGGDPYNKRVLADAAQADGTRRAVHPYLYPPPFLLLVGWTRPMPLHSAYLAWFAVGVATTLGSLGVLLGAWRREGVGVPLAVGVLAGGMTALPNNLVMGQANTPVLLAVLAGLWAASAGRDRLGGALVGLGCVLKMSPALFVAWWLLRGRWRAAAWAVGSAVVLSGVALVALPVSVSRTFWLEVLPGFGSGRYNALTVGIDLFGNHSLPNLWDAVWPHADGRHLALSAPARVASVVSAVGLVAGVGWLLRRDGDGLARAGQVGAVGVVMLLVPVITYEHHLVWAIPAAVASFAALLRGRLARGWAWALVPATLLLMWDLQALKSASRDAMEVAVWLGVALREAKFGALVLLLASSVAVGRSKEPS